MPITVHTKYITLPDLSKIGYCAVPDLHKNITRSLSYLKLSELHVSQSHNMTVYHKHNTMIYIDNV